MRQPHPTIVWYLAVPVGLLVLAGCGGGASSAISAAPSASLGSTAPASSGSPPTGASPSTAEVSDASGDVSISGIDIVAAKATKDGQGNLKIDIRLRGPHTRSTMFGAKIRNPTGAAYDLNASLLPAGNVFGVYGPGGVQADATGVVRSKEIVISVRAQDVGWAGGGDYLVQVYAVAGLNTRAPTDHAPNRMSL